jgi:hypothetical protein
VDDGMQGFAPAGARAARLALVMQTAAARIGLRWQRGSRNVLPTLGEYAALLSPRDCMGLVWAWSQRNGAWSWQGVAGIYQSLSAASSPMHPMSLPRAAVEVDLLAALPVQPPPPGYMDRLIGTLAAVADSSEGSVGMSSLSRSRQVSILAALAAHRSWATEGAHGEFVAPLCAKLLLQCLRDDRLEAYLFQLALKALARLHTNQTYSVTPE